jgi:glycosyltransferase involved in cell wall biosynthesis
MICCVIPTYRARATICDVVRATLEHVDLVLVVDDACPQRSGDLVAATFERDRRVRVIQREHNGGVGAAVKSGIAACIELEADIIIKLDADGQMDPGFIPAIVRCFHDDPSLAYVKGNRFVNASVLQRMPKVRLFGNAALSLLVKFASGYWNVLDPTNGYVAFNRRALPYLEWQSFADSYFFEISVLGELGLRQAAIGEIEMPAVYGEERSSLSIRRVLVEFPPKLLRLTMRRLLLQYFLFDVNLGSIYVMLGTCLSLFAALFGGFEWWQTYISGHPRPLGTIMLVAVTALIGVQLLLNALLYDVQFAPKTFREFGMRAKEQSRFLRGRMERGASRAN